jgi:ACT domain-containing protein
MQEQQAMLKITLTLNAEVPDGGYATSTQSIEAANKYSAYEMIAEEIRKFASSHKIEALAVRSSIIWGTLP